MPLLTDAEAVDKEIGEDWTRILDEHRDEETPAEAPALETPDPAAAAPAEVPGDEAAPAAAPDRARAEDGKFVKTRPAKVEKVAAAPADPAAPPADPNDPAAPHPNARTMDITRAPSSWKPAARAEFAKLPESARQEIHRREADYMARQAEVMPIAQFGRTMKETIEPFRMLIDSEGGTPEGAVRELLLTAASLRTGTMGQKFQTMANIAARYGVPLTLYDKDGKPLNQQQQSQVFNGGGAPGSAPQPFQDPRVDELLRSMQTRDEQEAQSRYQANLGTVNAWMTANDAQGQPLRPYVNDVLDDMMARVQTLRAANPNLTSIEALDQAYTAATWANPEVRQILLDQQGKQAEAKRRAESQQRVRGARQAASVNVPRRSSIPAQAAPVSMDQTLMDTARTLGLISS